MSERPKRRQPIDTEIAEVMKQERRTKGKRGPAALASAEEQNQLENDFDYLLRRGTEVQFLAKIRQLQLPAESGGEERLLKLFRELRRS
jgi:hypothetical protein